MIISTANINKTVAILKKLCSKKIPDAYIITGSGQKNISSKFKEIFTISLSKLPGFAKPSVKGHASELKLCQYKQKCFFVQSGRSQLYENNSFEDILFPIEIIKKLGLKKLLLLNAAGAVNKKLRTGDIVIIKDHINLMLRNPLFANKKIDQKNRFLSMRPCYDQSFIKYIQREKKGKTSWKTGVYAGVIGPVYETRSELNMLDGMGADVVGMSTVQEAIYAKYLGIEVSAASMITNDRSNAANHNEVIKASIMGERQLIEVIKKYIMFI